MSLNMPEGAPGATQVRAAFLEPSQRITGAQDAFLQAAGPFRVR